MISHRNPTLITSEKKHVEKVRINAVFSVLISSLFAGLILAQPVSADVFCRFLNDGHSNYGRVEGNSIIVLTDAPWLGGKENGKTVLLNEVKLLPPAEPRSIIGIAGAYAAPGSNPPVTSRWFAKSASAAATDGTEVVIPPSLDALKVEVELVIVIGQKTRDASIQQAATAIFGYATGTEIFGFVQSYHRVSGDNPDRNESMLAAGLKLGDNFAPFGPFIYTDVDWRERQRKLTITTAAGELRVSYSHNTSGLLYPPAKIVSDLSRVVTLEPGDLIFSGTSKSFVIEAGETVTTEIEGFGTISNLIVRSSPTQAH